MRPLLVLSMLLVALPLGAQEKTAYSLKGTQIEGCECDVYCQCVFSKDATMDQCRGVLAWKVTEGSYGDVPLDNLVFAASMTKSGKNIDKSLGTLEGTLFLPEAATDAQRNAIRQIVTAEMGSAFARMDSRTVPISLKLEKEHYEVRVGAIADLRITALKNGKGAVTTIENAPSPLVMDKLFCARADVNTYDDGTSKWDFAGRNGFYSPFEMKSK